MADSMTQRVVQIIIDAKNQTATGLAGAAADLEGFQSTIRGIGKSVATIGLGMLGVGLAISAVGAGVVDVAARFDSALITTQNNTTMTNGDIQTMRSTVLDLAQSTGAPFDQLEQGFMRVMNISGNAAAAQDILAIATESAVSTGGDAASVANVLANAMHEYGLDTSNAATAQQRNADITANATRVMGVMHLAAAESNMTLEQFSESSGKMIGIAANLGIPIEQVSAAFAALTKHGYNASQAQTQMVDMMTHMIHPTKAAEAEVKKLSQATGIDLVGDFSAAGLSSKGLDGVLGDLKRAYEKMGYSQADATSESMNLINAQRGGLGLASLLGTAWDDNSKILGDLTNKQLVSSVTTDAMQRTQGTLTNQMARLKNGLEASAIALGEQLMPYVQQAVTAIIPLIHQVGEWMAAHGKLVAAIMVGVAAFTIVVGLILTIAGAALILASVLNPLTLIVAGVTIAVGLFGAAWLTNFHGVRDTTQSVVGFVQAQLPAIQHVVTTVFQAVQTVIQSVLGTVEPFVEATITQITGWWLQNHQQIQEATQRVWSAIQAAIQIVMPIIQAIIQAGLSVISTFWSADWQAIQVLLSAVWDIIKTIVTTDIKIIEDLIMIGVDIINGNWSGAWQQFQDILSTTWTAAESIVKVGVDAVIGILDVFIKAWDGLKLSIPGFSITIPSVDVPGGGKIGGETLSWGGFSESFMQIPPIPMLAAGGIALGPTLALIGESGPEAVLPLSDLNNPGVGGISAPRGGGTVVNNYLQVSGNRLLNTNDLGDLFELFAQYVNRKMNTSLQH